MAYYDTGIENGTLALDLSYVTGYSGGSGAYCTTSTSEYTDIVFNTHYYSGSAVIKTVITVPNSTITMSISGSGNYWLISFTNNNSFPVVNYWDGGYGSTGKTYCSAGNTVTIQHYFTYAEMTAGTFTLYKANY